MRAMIRPTTTFVEPLMHIRRVLLSLLVIASIGRMQFSWARDRGAG